MILDNLAKSLTDYSGLHPRFARAFEWLRTIDVAKIPVGDFKTYIDGERMFAKSLEYGLCDPSQVDFETHLAYIDIQVMLSGREVMHWAPACRLPKIKTPYDYVKDVVLYEDPVSPLPVLVSEGEFAIFFPSDGHKGMCKAPGSERVRKLVIKVAV